MRRWTAAQFAVSLSACLLIFTGLIIQIGAGILPGSITILAFPDDIIVGESTVIGGYLNPPSPGETVTIWRRISGSTSPWGILATTTSNTSSQYSYTWTNTTIGTYELKSTWIGDEYAAQSPIITIDVKAPPVASFIYTPDDPVVDETITFDASGSYDPDGTITSYAWSFGDMSTGSGVTTTHTYILADTYNVTLIIIDDDGLPDNETMPVTIFLQPLEPPVASFTYSPSEPQVGEIVTFDASTSFDPDGTIVSYEWNFGDGIDGTGEIVNHTYTEDATFLTILNVTDNNGLSNTTSMSITVLNRPPNAIFTESAEAVYTNEVITFNASDSFDPDGTIVSYFWDFGDGNEGANLIVGHSYTDDGNYTVTLTVTDDDGATDNATAIKTVLNRAPVALFLESIHVVFIDVSIQFNASESYDSDGEIVSYFWDFGDGTNTTGVTAEHAYTTKGEFTVTLTVTDDDGAQGLELAVKTVLNQMPIAILDESTEVAVIGEPIMFNASDSYDPDGEIISYYWSFGDGTEGSGITISHAYDTNGTFTVTLTVTDDDDGSNSTTSIKTIMTNEMPIPSFTESAHTFDTFDIITFDASASYDPDGTIVAYSWEFGDGAISTDMFPEHSYADDGIYTVTLTITDDDGGTASASAVKTVRNRPPIALIGHNVTTIGLYEVIRFDASYSYDSDGEILSYVWDFGDGTSATMCIIIDHPFNEGGEHLVTLTVTDNDGSSSSDSVRIIVNAPPDWSFLLVVGVVLGIAASAGIIGYLILRRRGRLI
ncbi:MAG: PKD domain-containing protein [Candidatus Bathyarchaeota archaeon]|nr:MAG: PKD domain-containing protein [Candidatus Bathyarchaeota archaeon]